ncbi:MAG: hypothetical protein IJR62_01535 [Lachnospiraceae bacterium]|nr:hypothetical protein [Lachnospiraceae bacterium]
MIFVYCRAAAEKNAAACFMGVIHYRCFIAPVMNGRKLNSDELQKWF